MFGGMLPILPPLAYINDIVNQQKGGDPVSHSYLAGRSGHASFGLAL
jgi:hypothetical protein